MNGFPTRLPVPGRLAAQPVLLLALVLLFAQAGTAQHFAFVSDRILQNGGRMVDGTFYTQAEIFTYSDGSELRLTRTPDRNEYDPVPSPDGRYIAYAWQEIADPPREATDSQWHLSVIDTLLGREQATWILPNSRQMTRPADGFRMTWMSDSSGFLALSPTEAGGWEVRRFRLASADSYWVADGYGPFLSPDEAHVATELNGRGHVWRLADGEEIAVLPGTVLGWFDAEHLFVATDGGLGLTDVQAGGWQKVTDYYGYYHSLEWSPDGQRYATLLLQDRTWYVLFHERDHDLLEDYAFPGTVHDLDWLGVDRVLVSLETEDGDLAIASLDLDGNDPFLVRSIGNDHSARAMPRSYLRP